MSSVAYAVVADMRRLEPASRLATSLSGALFVDNGSLSVWENHARAWRYAAAQGKDWTVVLQDDALPIDNFDTHFKNAVEHLPTTGVVGLYVGISRPPQWQARIDAAITASDATDAAWIKARVLLWGVGVAIPSDRVLDMLDTAGGLPIPYDQAIGWWARHEPEPMPIYYPSHSLIDHADWPTLIRHQDGQPRVEPRRAWRIGEPRLNRRYVDL